MKNKEKIAIILNILIIVFEILGVVVSLIKTKSYDLIYYTQDSNMLGLIASIFYLAYVLRDKELPKWVSILKYSSVLCLTVTFLVVLLILGPMYKFDYLMLFFRGSMLFTHFLCPLLAFISFIFFESHKISGLRDNLRATYFTIFYAVVTLLLNILKIIKGPYPFLYVYENPIYASALFFIVIVGGAFGMSKVIERIKR